MIKEIGSEFWISDINTSNTYITPDWLSSWGNIMLTSSGRGAISLLLRDIQPKCRTALLPAYICESVIKPFIAYGYNCYFYDLNDDFEASLKSINYSDIGIFLHMGYFGFPTNLTLDYTINKLRENSTIIIEDITHSLFSDYSRPNTNDYYIASLRKWIGIPSGGFLASHDKAINKVLPYNNAFSDIRKNALTLKENYNKSLLEEQKLRYLNLFKEAENILDIDVSPYNIDDFSKILISELDVERLINRRIDNFLFLSEGLKDLKIIKPIFNKIPKSVCPMFYPVYIYKDRLKIRNFLSDNKIYCPIHWPIPQQVEKLMGYNALNIYNSVLSIPCDQRYGIDDMSRIVKVLNELI